MGNSGSATKQWPVITGTLNRDGTGRLVIAGQVSVLRSDTLTAVRANALELIAATVESLDREKLDASIQDPDGLWLISVNRAAEVVATVALSVDKHKRSTQRVSEDTPKPAAEASAAKADVPPIVVRKTTRSRPALVEEATPVGSLAPDAQSGFATEEGHQVTPAAVARKADPVRIAAVSQARVLVDARRVGTDAGIARIERDFMDGVIDADEWLAALNEHTKWMFGETVMEDADA
jgi:hypothetical protein